TSFLAPEMTVAIRAMSVGGAAVGSGGLNESWQGNPKEGVYAALARAADQMHAPQRALVDAANQCDVEGVTAPAEKRKKLFEQMFPGVPWDQRRETVMARVRDNVNAALAAYNRAVEQKLAQYADEIAAMRAPHNNRGPMPIPSREECLVQILQ